MARKNSSFGYEVLVRYMLPNGILDYFEITKIDEEVTNEKDETALQHDLFTFLSNKDGHGRKGTLVTAVKGTTVADVTRYLEKILEESRRKVKEITMGFSDSMMGIVKKNFPQAEIVIDMFHVMQLFGTKGLDAMRMKLKRAHVTELKQEERAFKKRTERQEKEKIQGAPRPGRARTLLNSCNFSNFVKI